MSPQTEVLEKWEAIPPFAHAQMLKALDDLMAEVGPRKGVFLVTPGIQIPEATALQLPAAEMIRRLNPFRSEWFQIVFLQQGEFERLLENRGVADIDGIPQLLELIDINDPHTHVVVAVVERHVYHWSRDGVKARAAKIREAEADPTFSYSLLDARNQPDPSPSIPVDCRNS